jgi:hypothetical protein
VYVATAPRPRDEQALALAKLDQGLEHQLPLVLAKTAISREAHGSRVQALERRPGSVSATAPVVGVAG